MPIASPQNALKRTSVWHMDCKMVSPPKASRDVPVAAALQHDLIHELSLEKMMRVLISGLFKVC